MIKQRHNIIVLAAAVIISAGIWLMAFAKQTTPKNISARVFHGSLGWGYDIMINDTLFIHQESVPGISNNKGFPLKAQAEQMTKLIINKMKRGQHPVVTTFELEQIFPANEREYKQYKP